MRSVCTHEMSSVVLFALKPTQKGTNSENNRATQTRFGAQVEVPRKPRSLHPLAPLDHYTHAQEGT